MSSIVHLYELVRDFIRQLGKMNMSAYSASTAFFFFISLFPLMTLLSILLPYTGLTLEELSQVILSTFPSFVSPLLVQIAGEAYSHSPAVMSISIVGIIWAAGRGMLALIRGFNAVYEVKEHRNYFHLRAVATFYTTIMLVLMVLSLLLLVFGGRIKKWLVRFLPFLTDTWIRVIDFRYIFMFLLGVLLFSWIYCGIPNVRLRFVYQVPGAIFSALAWGGFSIAFSIYINHFFKTSTYGSLWTIIILMLWLYANFYILLLGAYINRYFQPSYEVHYARHREKKKRG